MPRFFNGQVSAFNFSYHLLASHTELSRSQYASNGRGAGLAADPGGISYRDSIFWQRHGMLKNASWSVKKPEEIESDIYPNIAKVGGLQSQGDKGAAVVDLLQAHGNAGSCVLRLSRRGKKMA
jgi:hypothetical protein